MSDEWNWFDSLPGDAQEEVIALRQVVQAIADGPADSDTYLCNYCDEYIGGIFGHTTHKPECPVTKARVLLAGDVPRRKRGTRRKCAKCGYDGLVWLSDGVQREDADGYLCPQCHTHVIVEHGS